jgi:hypothetical protein
VKHFNIYGHPSGDFEAVKGGWSWPAFLLGWPWLLFKKMWAPGITLGLSLILVAFFLGDANEYILSLVGLSASIVLGGAGNGWRAQWLLSRGFEHVGVVEAANPSSALALHLKARQPAPPALQQPLIALPRTTQA